MKRIVNWFKKCYLNYQISENDIALTIQAITYEEYLIIDDKLKKELEKIK